MRYVYQSKERPGLHKEILGIENIDKVIEVSQDPIGRTPRSNPVTYTVSSMIFVIYLHKQMKRK